MQLAKRILLALLLLATVPAAAEQAPADGANDRTAVFGVS